jgi:hypothetical protein
MPSVREVIGMGLCVAIAACVMAFVVVLLV